MWKRKNSISKLMDDTDIWREMHSGLSDLINNHFRDLFSSSSTGLFTCSHLLSPVISDEMNANLLAPFTVIEVKRALDSMHPNKAPRFDGYNPAFYQHMWNIVGGDVTNEIMQVLHGWPLPKMMNRT